MRCSEEKLTKNCSSIWDCMRSSTRILFLLCFRTDLAVTWRSLSLLIGGKLMGSVSIPLETKGSAVLAGLILLRSFSLTEFASSPKEPSMLFCLPSSLSIATLSTRDATEAFWPLLCYTTQLWEEMRKAVTALTPQEKLAKIPNFVSLPIGPASPTGPAWPPFRSWPILRSSKRRSTRTVLSILASLFTKTFIIIKKESIEEPATRLWGATLWKSSAGESNKELSIG